MTRFARAEGSKSCNKRNLEDATPWGEMVGKFLRQARATSDSMEKTADALSEEKDEVPECQIQKKNKADKQEKKVGYTLDDGKKVKVFKNGIKRPWFDLPYEEDEYMTRYENFWVATEKVKELDALKETLKNDELDDMQIKRKMMKAKRKAHNELRKALIYKQRDFHNQENKNMDSYDAFECNSTNKLKKQKNSKEKVIKNYPVNIDKSNGFTFQEDDLMTKFDGFWVLKDSVSKLENIKTKLHNKFTVNEEMTENLQIQFQRKMKKLKRVHHNILKEKLIELKKCNTYESSMSSSNSFSTNNSVKMTKFHGFWITMESAERLKALAEKFRRGGLSEKKINEILRSERRKEEKNFRKQLKHRCFYCREAGHSLSECQAYIKENSILPNTCFKCGSTEHKSQSCKKAEYENATCFICKETGHIARECPDNPKGLYPYGGCCRNCGSVEHLKKDCPKMKKMENNEACVNIINTQNLEGLDDEAEVVKLVKKKKIKIISFK